MVPIDGEDMTLSVYGLMRTGASGMTAQSDRLGTVADNIANASTVGYKSANTEFSSLLIDSTVSSYASGGVETSVRYGISRQGTLSFTSSAYDLAIDGGGFMLVADPAGTISLARAGAFVPDSEGQLVNSAGFTLLGYPVVDGASDAVVANGIAGLVPIDVKQADLTAAATTAGALTTNLPSAAAVVAAVGASNGLLGFAADSAGWLEGARNSNGEQVQHKRVLASAERVRDGCLAERRGGQSRRGADIAHGAGEIVSGLVAADHHRQRHVRCAAAGNEVGHEKHKHILARSI